MIISIILGVLILSIIGIVVGKILKMKKIYVVSEILIVILVISVIGFMVYAIESESREYESKHPEVKMEEDFNNKETNLEDPNVKQIKNCQYKHFKPDFKDGYDFTQDMEYKDKIYHKEITTYDRYLTYKNRWNDICNMSKKDFENNFMIITAIENTSMLGLTVSNIEADENTLMISLDKYPDNEEYDSDKTCISIVIPNEMKRDKIEVKDVRTKEDTAEYKYNWKNESIEGLTKISADEAVEIAKRFAKQLTKSDSLMGKWLEGYTEVYEVKITEISPNNYWLITEGIVERELVMADYKRAVYEVVLVREDDEVEMDRAYFYVDLYTKEVIAGMERAD